jgi:hypothetical protein
MSGMDLSGLRYHELLELARQAVARATSHDLTELTDAEVIDAAQQSSEVAALATAAQVQAAGRLDTSKAWQTSGARSAAAWLAWQCRLPSRQANRAVRSARRLRDLPRAKEAFLAGRLTPDHVTLLASCHHANSDAYAVDEALLVGHATTLAFRHFERVVAYWLQLHDPDGSERDADAKHGDRRVDCSTTLDDMVVLDALLDPVTGAIVRRELERLEQELFEADWADARARLGDAATAVDLVRTPKQRRADALRRMAERSAAKPADAKEPRVLIHVLAGTDALQRMCELSDGTILTPGQLLPLIRWADLARVIFESPSKVIDIGVKQRLFSGATRTAVELRDLECQHPGCHERFERCEVDHIQPWEHGGPTIQANGQLLCPFHHRWRHRRLQPAP